MTAKTERIDLRVPEQLKALVGEAAALSGMTLSAFIAAAARERAENVMRNREQLRLAEADRDRFLAALDRPARALPESIRRAREQYKTRVV